MCVFVPAVKCMCASVCVVLCTFVYVCPCACMYVCAYVSTVVACHSRCHWPHRSGQLGMRAHIQVSNCSSHCCPIQSHCPAVPRYWWQGEPGRSPLGGRGVRKVWVVFFFFLQLQVALLRHSKSLSFKFTDSWKGDYLSGWVLAGLKMYSQLFCQLTNINNWLDTHTSYSETSNWIKY